VRADGVSLTTALASSRVLTAGVMAAVVVTMTALAFGFPPAARLMPLLAGIPGSVLALICLGREIKLALEEAALKAAHGRRAERAMLAWTLAFFAGILAAGFLIAAPVLVVAYLRFGSHERWLIALTSAAITWALLYGLFELAFRIPLFDGLLVAVLST
jgi:hypothetical protein